MDITIAIHFFPDPCYFEGGYPSNDIITTAIVVNDAASCQKECQKNDQCQFWTFNSGNGACWLKSDKTSESPGAGKTSGPKFCPG